MVYSILKIGTGLAVEFGVGTMAAEATMKLIPEAASTATKVCCYVGGAAVAGVAGKLAHEYTDNLFESTKELVQVTKELRKENKTKKQIKKKDKELRKQMKEMENEKFVN